MLEQLALYLQYPFVRYALIVGVLIALCSSLLGVTLVLKRFSFIGDGLSHVAFGAMAIAAVLNLANDMLLVLPVTVISAVLLLRTGQKTKIKGDAAIAMISVGALAFGYLIMNIFSTSSNLSGDVCSTLFGYTSILALDRREVWLCAVLSVLVVIIFILFYNKIFAVTFDEDFSAAAGTRASTYNLLIAIVIAVIIVLAMNLVGSLLISALVIFPALSAMRLFKSFRSVTICSAVLSVICAFSGIIISILAGTPVGSTIVAVDVAAVAVCCAAGGITGRLEKMEKRAGLLICLVLVLAMTGCGNSGASGRTGGGQPAGVNEVLASGMAEADSKKEDDTGEPAEGNTQDRQSKETPEPKAPKPSPEPDTGPVPSNSADGIDVDLTALSSTMVYSEVYNMMVSPDRYVGKTVKMSGLFDYYRDEVTGNAYFTCIIQDATACCAQGIEFVLAGDHVYPDDYPEIGEEICVVGVFDTYRENEYLYCTLRQAELV